MFQQFMGNIQELYDDVGSFFNDLLTKETISDIVKTTTSSSRNTPTSTTSTQSRSPMFDFDSSDDMDMSFIREMREEHQNKKAVQAVDYNTINDEWVKRLQGIAFKRPYNDEEALSNE